ncbi:cAMP-binding domain of CRP or a regulatory subunit of cAMP-dependent protein kinases [Chitinophaga ginsengisegetis]|uniref:cAMP-binding domain of CRP or a regulatory subunit of cAMP-dependent protein kinases n=1 Tax=Chitinophaga ginsengisegetis TaxID=393003 RepID=A0A1T5N4L5_9BACT|nr:Crp/Fnr family transcriptional regulator [Chitinophaga ginsengisegetis]MDR6571152.1 CRP-like cAMP-binding protein [Chitinophaga ginsengisegetis]MDR6650886.1 CRP-like cAMP-binding protein [Chitinophaga ginsengisegetis]MDR6657227.1 CRP-like cAMP-binding protein [Chitinophaga ginsengisegetis]SKC95284.1 cAMP-binding domain of CRP or a regulatory subunit of cAMP-dependent protein kinases [Chitinophaga ginsengisegetis]
MSASITTLQQLLFDLAGILPADTAPLFAMTRQAKLAANETYIREGDTERRLAFIEQGIMRAYIIKSNGDEATLFLRWEKQFIASHDTIIHRRPSRFIYRALEPTTLLEIDYDVLEEVLKTHPEYEPLRNFFLMRMLSESLNIMESFVTLSPEERYRNLLAERFDLVNRVPDKYIASMLGITPVSLSRIRKRMLDKGKG